MLSRYPSEPFWTKLPEWKKDHLVNIWIRDESYLTNLPSSDTEETLFFAEINVGKKWNKLNQIFSIFTHLKLCLATTTHNFKCVKITDIS